MTFPVLHLRIFSTTTCTRVYNNRNVIFIFEYYLLLLYLATASQAIPSTAVVPQNSVSYIYKVYTKYCVLHTEYFVMYLLPLQAERLTSPVCSRACQHVLIARFRYEVYATSWDRRCGHRCRCHRRCWITSKHMRRNQPEPASPSSQTEGSEGRVEGTNRASLY